MFADDFAYYAKSANGRQSVKYLSDCLATFPAWLSRARKSTVRVDTVTSGSTTFGHVTPKLEPVSRYSKKKALCRWT